MPSHAETADGSSLTYTYLADGTKVSAKNGGNGLRYIGSFTYSDFVSNNSLESIACDEGRYSLVGDDSFSLTMKDLFFVTDHLGNVRSIADVSPGLTAPVILEQNDYLPFGTKVQNSSYANVTENRYRYAGKEEQNIGGINLSLLDFGARYYDPYVARWTSVDSMAEKYLCLSPYNYIKDNPLVFVDVDGNRPIPLNKNYKQWYVKVDSWFGHRNTGLKGASTFHKGLDFNYSGGGDSDFGSPILSTHEGFATIYDNNEGKSGRYVIITSPDGLFRTKYYHLSSISVEDGQYVFEGSDIGAMGGSAMGSDRKWTSHLHYEIQEFHDGTWVSIDPTGNNPNTLDNIEDPQKRIPLIDRMYYGGILVPAVITP